MLPGPWPRSCDVYAGQLTEQPFLPVHAGQSSTRTNSQIGQFWMDVNSWPTPHPEIKLILRNGKRNVSMTLHSTVLRLLADLDTAAVYQHQRLRSDFVGPDECIHSASATTRFCHDF